MTRPQVQGYHQALSTLHPDGIPPHRIVFHYFHGSRHLPSQGSISAETFEDILEFIGVDMIVPADEWLRRAGSSTLAPGDVCLGFDDALRCQYDVALPVLRSKGLSALFFVNTHVVTGGIESLEIYRHFRNHAFPSINAFYDAFETAVRSSSYVKSLTQGLTRFDAHKYLSDFPFYTAGDRRFRYIRDMILGPEAFDQIMNAMIQESGMDIRSIADAAWMDEECVRALVSEGHVVGLHGHHHPTKMDALIPEEQAKEYSENASEILRITGKRALVMSHPCNSYSADTLRILRQLGIHTGFRGGMHGPYMGGLEHASEDPALVLNMPGFKTH